MTFVVGGGLYALGLIHANHGGTIIDYLLNQLKGATNESVKHGGCLGLGLAAMGTHRADVYEQVGFSFSLILIILIITIFCLNSSNIIFIKTMQSLERQRALQWVL